jgi:hypothetical protein
VIALGWDVLAPGGGPPERTVAAHSFVKAFRCGWRRLHDDAAMPTNLDQRLREWIEFRTDIR